MQGSKDTEQANTCMFHFGARQAGASQEGKASAVEKPAKKRSHEEMRLDDSKSGM